MTINRKGCTRIVVLTKNYAFKVPCFLVEWRLFLLGLLANMQEARFARMNWPQLCPIIFRIPGGFLNVMPRAKSIPFDDFWYIFPEEDDLNRWAQYGDYVVPVEYKPDSFGFLNGKLVAVDYGN